MPYRFLHDRVQQAAYSLIPDDQKQTTHYHIGQLLLQQISPEAREDRIFELVNQFNYGIALIAEQSERDELAQLNLIACCKAKAATAYQAGREYAAAGLSLLGEASWQRQYQMTLAFHDLATELASLDGDFAAMEQWVNPVITQAHTLLEKVNVYRTRIQAHVFQNQTTVAVAIAQQFLQQLGVTFPLSPSEEDIQQAFLEVQQLIGERNIEDFANLPRMTDPEKVAIMQILTSTIPAASTSGSPLLPLITALSVKLSIQYGNVPASAFAYVVYGFLPSNRWQDVNTRVKFAQLALQVVTKLDAKTVKSEVFNVVGFMLHHKCHIKETLSLFQEVYKAGLEAGNLEFIGYNAQSFCRYSFWCSSCLENVEQGARAYSTALAQLNQLATANQCRITWQSTLNLLGFATDPSVLTGEVLQESELLSLLTSANDLFGLYCFYSFKLMLAYLFGDIEAAKQHAIQLKSYLQRFLFG